MYCPPLTAPDEFGLVYDSTAHGGMHRYNPSGMAIFATIEDRTAAMNEMIQLGFRYMVTYRDVNGAGLSWCYKPHWPEYAIRPSRLAALPSRSTGPALWRRGASPYRNRDALYRNPGYDLVNDPDPRYLEKSYV